MRIQPFAFIGGGAESFLAIGGTVSGSFVSASVEYQFHIFSSSGDFEVLRGTNDSVEILLVGAGGSGYNDTIGNAASIGGGGGGVIYTSSINLSKAVYAVNVGTSSKTDVSNTDISQGSSFLGNSVFFAVSGANDYSGYPQFNSPGASTTNAGQTAFGGGGGAGGAGFSGSYGGAYPLKFKGGDGGSGSLVRIKNESFYVAGGGAGGYPNITDVAGVGGIGGGASSGQNPIQYSGGGGAGEFNGGSNATQGASGSVIIQYRTLGYPPYTFTLSSGSTALQACQNYGSGSTATYYTYVTIIGSGSAVYGPNDYNGTPTDGYYSNGTQNWYLLSGSATSSASGCPVIYSLTLSSGSEQYAPAACLDFASGSTATYYSVNTPTPQSGSLLYLDSALSITASNGFIASGSGYWQILNGAPISTSATACSTIYSLTLSGNVTSSASGACFDTTTKTYFSLTPSIQSGSLLFSTSSMTAVVGDGFLSNATSSWQFISGAATTTVGTTCPPPIPAEYFVTGGLQFMVDAGSGSSYPGSGSTWFDISGNGYNATLVGSPTYTSNASASYFSFDGSSQYGTFTPPLAEGDTTYSYFAIFYPNANETKMILYQGNETTNRRGAMIQCDSSVTPPNGGLGFNGFANDSISGCGGVVAVSLSNWQTFSFTLDEVAATPFNLYKNGALSASGSSTGVTTDLNLGTNAARIGANGGNGEIFNGRIAVCMMYNRVLTADEIKQNHNYFAGRYGLARV